MALFRWRGNGAGTKTSWIDGRNWVNESDAAYAQARYPGSVASTYDDVVFDDALVTGASAPSTDMDQSASTAGYVNSIRVGADYTSTIAGVAAWLKITALSVFIDAQNAGAIYLNGAGAGTTGLQNLIITNGSSIYLDGDLTTPQFLKGVITLAATTVIYTSCYVGYVTSAGTDCTLVIPAGATLPATVEMRGGIVTNANAVTTYNLYAGTLTHSAGAITTLNNYGATVYWNGGNITTLNNYSGSIDASDSITPRRIGTIVNRQAGSINLDNGVNNIKVTSYIQNYKGTLTLANGVQLQEYATETIAGASDVVQGIAPISIAAAPTTVNGTAVLLGLYERLDVYCTVGVTDTSSVFIVQEDDTTAMGSPVAIAGKTVTLAGADDGKTKLITVWGYELTAGNYAVRVSVTNTGGTGALVAVTYVKKTFAA